MTQPTTKQATKQATKQPSNQPSKQPATQQPIALLSESTTITRIPNPDGEGELLEVKVTTKVRTHLGVSHDTTQTFILNGNDASDTLASVRVIHNNLQLTMMRAEQESASRAEAEAESLSTAGTSAGS